MLAAVAIVVLVGGLFMGVLAPPAPLPTPSPTIPATEVPRTEIKQAREQLEGGSAVMVDTRSPEEYAQAHIEGAISIPFRETEARSGELPKDKEIILY